MIEKINRLIGNYIVIGISQLVLSIIMILTNAHIFYLYHFNRDLDRIKYPDWILVANILIGVIGLLLGFATIGKKMSPRKSFYLVLAIVFIGNFLKKIFVI